jgi:hypothetical protein
MPILGQRPSRRQRQSRLHRRSRRVSATAHHRRSRDNCRAAHLPPIKTGTDIRRPPRHLRISARSPANPASTARVATATAPHLPPEATARAGSTT